LLMIKEEEPRLGTCRLVLALVPIMEDW